MVDQKGEITEVLSEWASAEQRGDTTLLKRLLTDDFLGVGPLGFTLSKEDWLARPRSGDLKYDTFQLTDVQSRSYGTAVVVVAHHVTKGAYRDRAIPSDLRATLVLVNPSGAWLLAGIYMSFIAGTPGAPPIPG